MELLLPSVKQVHQDQRTLDARFTAGGEHRYKPLPRNVRAQAGAVFGTVR